LIAFLMAALIAGGATFFIGRRLQPVATGPGTIQIVAAAKDLSTGVPLTAGDLTMISWPDNVPLNGSIKKIEDTVGRPLIQSVAAKQPLLERDLAAPGSGYGLSGKIPPGMRATAVRSNDIVGVAGFLYPGSHVDVVATYTMPGGQPGTQTVLQDVEVLSTGTSVEPDPQGKPQTVNVVTLLLTPENSQKLLLASAQGSIQFVLRSGVDREVVQIPPTKIEQLLAGSVPPPPPPPPKPAPRPVAQARVVAPVVVPPVAPAPKAPEPHVIEVIQGNQRSIQKFEEADGPAASR
jgi:pilus assembly protein CpaB